MAFHLHELNGLSWVTSDLLPAKHMFTRRLGEVGDYPFCSVRDLEWEKPERQARVRAQWLVLREAGGFPEEGICFTRQVHGTFVRIVGKEERQLPPLPRRPEDCDGLATAERDVPLCVFSADCVPVLLCDPAAGVAAAVHSGWKGTVADMMGSAVERLTGMGARPENIYAAIGPCASVCCYETGPEVKEAVEAMLGPDAAGLCRPEEGVPGKYMVDLKETNRRALLRRGVQSGHIDVSPDCTMCMSDVYWSHRAAKGVRGTQASIIML